MTRLTTGGLPRVSHWLGTTFCVILLMSGCGGGASEPDGTAVVPENPDYAVTPTQGESASDTNPQVVNGDTIEDYHYAVSLTRPSAGWQLLKEERATELVPDAFLGMVNVKHQAYAVMIAERLPDVSLEDYLTLITSSGPLATANRQQQRQVTIDGQSGVRLRMEALIEGLPFNYTMQIVRRGDFFYQFVGWALSEKYTQVADEYERLADSLTFAKDRQPQPRSKLSILNDQSHEWVISEGVYSNAAHGFRLVPQPELRLCGRLEIEQMNAMATAAVTSTSGEFYQIYLTEPVGSMPQDQFLETVYEGINIEKGVAETPPREPVTIAGVDGELLRYKNLVIEGAEYDFTVALFFHGNRFFRIESWTSSAHAEQYEPLLQRSYDMLQWLTDDEVAELQQQLRDADVDNAVGPQFSMRNGTFQDFEFGYSVSLPAGYWQVTTGDAATLQNPDARVFFSETSDGVQFLVIPEHLPNFEHEEYHAALLSNFTLPAEPDVVQVEHADGTLLRSSFDTILQQTPIRFELITAKHGDRCVQILGSCLGSLATQLADRTEQIISGFQMPANGLQSEEVQGRTYVDHRLGFRLALPAGWERNEFSMPEIRPIGNMVIYSQDQAAINAMAMCVDAPFQEDVVIDAIATQMGIDFDVNSRQESQSTLAGLPAKQVVMTGRSGRSKVFFKLWIAHRANSVYMYMVNGEQGSTHERNAENYRKFFNVID